MEFLTLLLLIVIICLLLAERSNLEKKMNRLEYRMLEMFNILDREYKGKPEAGAQPSIAPTAADLARTNVPEKEPLMPKVSPPLPIAVSEPVIIPQSVLAPKPVPVSSPVLPRVKKPGFLARHPDLEKFIGENLLSKIGIAILVLAIGFFVKYAIDNNWIGPVARVGVGILCGGILIAIAHTLRKTYAAFSSVLVGGGLAVLYFTITLGFHEFHIFSQLTSFLLLITITCFAVALSLLYDRQELAVIALIGGLSSPFMVSTATVNYPAFFSYLVILNTGLLVTAYFKSWRILNASAFVFTVIICLLTLGTLPQQSFLTTFLYFSIFFILFLVSNIAHNVKEKKDFRGFDFSILLANTGLYFAAGLFLLTIGHHTEFRGLFSAGLGGTNLFLAFILFRNQHVDRNVLFLFIAITLTCISIAAPLQLHGHYITMFWGAESVVLLWLYQKSHIQLMKLAACAILVLMVISLILDWSSIYNDPGQFITGLVAFVSALLFAFLVAREPGAKIYGLPTMIILLLSIAILFIAGLLEVNQQFIKHYRFTELNQVYLQLYIVSFAVILDLVMNRFPAIKSLPWEIKVVMPALAIIAYLLYMGQVREVLIHRMLIVNLVSKNHFLAHWLAALLTCVLFYQLIKLGQKHWTQSPQKILTWILSGVLVLFLSLELGLVLNEAFYAGSAGSLAFIEIVYIKTGLPILWGVASFIFMWVGMHFKARTLRIISLSLFTLTLLKLFLFDIRNIPEAGKIAAFFALGVLLLIVSFMYQKVKKVIIEDDVAG